MAAKIVIASTLKPVTDPRVFEKIGRSIACHGTYDVNIIGNVSDILKIPAGITLHPHAITRRNLIARLFLPVKILKKIVSLKPDILIVTTHELLFVGVLYRILFRKRLVYDIQENYNYNLRYQDNYIWGLRQLLGWYIRAKEIIAGTFVDLFFLAEACYRDEIGFIKQRKTILLENKFAADFYDLEPVIQDKDDFLISGTISKLYGVLDAVEFAKHFPADKYNLRIIGHCPDQQLRAQLEDLENEMNNCTVRLSDQPIAHHSILATIGERTIGLLPYQQNKSTENKVPTKLYEYLALGLPIIISKNKKWEKLVKSSTAGITIDFKLPPNTEQVCKSLSLIRASYNTDLKYFKWNYYDDLIIAAIERLL